jgi:glycosyltransferase involved in cell wall biosynthesis
MVSVSEESVLRVADYRDAKISVVIPAFNEAMNLPYVLPMIPDWIHEIILVDGHSTDNTVEIARHLVPDIKIIQQVGKGKGTALRCGIAACTGDIVVMMDADGSTDPREMERFIEVLLAGADFAKGSRFVGDGGSADLTWLRKLGNGGLSFIVNCLFRVRFTDLCYGYNAFWKRCLDYFEIDCEGFEVETLINLRVSKANLKIVEVSSYEHPRIYGRSNLRAFRDGWRVLKVILREWANDRLWLRELVTSRPAQAKNVAEDELPIAKQIEISQ